MIAPNEFKCDVFAYGSRSGAGNFQFLALTGGFSAEEHREVSAYSSLVGSSSTASNWEPIYAFYRAGSDRHVLARTVFLADGPRGADYMVRGVLLSRDALDAFHWDVEPLINGLRFLEEIVKPQRLEQILIKPPDANRLSQPITPLPPDGSSIRQIDPAVVQAILNGSVAVRGQGFEPESRLVCCLTLARYLPPDDRPHFSFSTELSHGEGARFRFAFFRDADSRVRERTMPKAAVFDWSNVIYESASETARDLSANDTNREPVSVWMDLVDRGLPPLFGLSLLRAPDAATEVAEALQCSMLKGGQSVLLSDLEKRLAKVRDAPRQLLTVRLDPRNGLWHGVSQTPSEALLRYFHQRIYASLDCENRQPWDEAQAESLVEIFDGGRFIDQSAKPDFGFLRAKVDEARAHGAYCDDFARLGAASIAVLCAYRTQRETVLTSLEHSKSPFGSDKAFLGWVVAANRLSSKLVNGALAEWLGVFAPDVRIDLLDDLLKELGTAGSVNERVTMGSAEADKKESMVSAARSIFTAFERTTKAEGNNGAVRSLWVRASRRLWPRLSDVLPGAFAARVALDHELLNELTTGVVEWLASPLLIQFSKRLCRVEGLSFEVREILATNGIAQLKSVADGEDPGDLESLLASCAYLVRIRAEEFQEPYKRDGSVSAELFHYLWARYIDRGKLPILDQQSNLLRALHSWPRTKEESARVNRSLKAAAKAAGQDREILQRSLVLFEKHDMASASGTIRDLKVLQQIIHSIEFVQCLEDGPGSSNLSG